MTLLKSLGLWLLLAIAIGWAVGGQCINYYKLSKKGTTALGLVREKKSHMVIQYSFEADGRSYQGQGRGDVGNSPYYQNSIGDPVLVHYLPGAPGINCLGDPERLFSGELLPVCGAILLFPTMIVSVLAFRYKKYIARREDT